MSILISKVIFYNNFFLINGYVLKTALFLYKSAWTMTLIPRLFLIERQKILETKKKLQKFGKILRPFFGQQYLNSYLT